jgi:hypothetical protein
MSGRMEVTDIQGPLATPEMIALIQTLYSNIPMQKITIKIYGQKNLVDGFLKEHYERPNDWYEDLGFSTVTYEVTENEGYEIKTDDYQEEMEAILINYI